jgi:peptidase E
VETLVKPMFLLADSQLLFWQTEHGRFLDRVRDALSDETSDREPKAAYLGASNEDNPAFFDLFKAAMEGIDIHECRMIPSKPSSEDFDYLDSADLILLAGGDIAKGWTVFKENGFNEHIIMRYVTGAIMIGVSAGAVQLGLKGWYGEDPTASDLFDTFRLVPLVIDVHAESSWSRLRHIVRLSGEGTRGIGIPAGGGAIFHPDGSVEPVRHPLTEFSVGEDGITQALLLPPDGTSTDAADE